MENQPSTLQSYFTDKGMDFLVSVVAVIVGVLLVRAFTKG